MFRVHSAFLSESMLTARAVYAPAGIGGFVTITMFSIFSFDPSLALRKSEIFVNIPTLALKVPFFSTSAAATDRSTFFPLTGTFRSFMAGNPNR